MKTVELSSIKPNPENPRVIKDEQFHKLVENIKRYPHFLEKRGIVHADGIILGGNMRYRAIQEALKDDAFRARVGVSKQTEIPVTWVQDASAWSEDDRQAFIILDNSPEGVSGEWDWDLLANQFEADDLNEWGLEVPDVFDVEEVDAPSLNDGDRDPFQQMTFTLHDEQAEAVKAAIDKAKQGGYGQSAINENSNGNALAWIAEVYNRG